MPARALDVVHPKSLFISHFNFAAVWNEYRILSVLLNGQERILSQFALRY